MPKSIESQWREGDKLLRVIESGAGMATVEKFKKLSADAQELVVGTLKAMAAEGDKKPQALIEALPVLVEFYGEIRNVAKEPEERSVYDTEKGSSLTEEALMAMVNRDIAFLEKEMEKKKEGTAPQTLH